MFDHLKIIEICENSEIRYIKQYDYQKCELIMIPAKLKNKIQIL